MTDKSPWYIKPNPLDYVPAEHLQAPPLAHTPTKYRVPAFARGATAAGWYLAIAAVLFILAVASGAI